MEIGWLKNLRGKKTMKEVAKNANISESYYSMIESGNRRPPVDTAQAIAEALSFDWHIFYEKQKNSAPLNRDSPNQQVGGNSSA